MTEAYSYGIGILTGTGISIMANIISAIIKIRIDIKRDISYAKAALLDDITEITEVLSKICDKQNTFHTGRITAMETDFFEKHVQKIYTIYPIIILEKKFILFTRV